jgi:hypothetical protein
MRDVPMPVKPFVHASRAAGVGLAAH